LQAVGIRGLFRREDEKKKAIKEKLEELCDLINLLDAYQFNHFRDYTRLDSVINSGILGKAILLRWKEIKPKLIRMAKISRHPPEAIRLMERKTILRFSQAIGLAFTTAVMIIPFIIPMGFTAFLLFIVCTLANIGIYAYMSFIDYKVSKIMVQYFNKHPEKYSSYRNMLKKWTQELIYIYGNYIRQIKGKPKDYPIELYNVDYNGIRIVKKPRLWRKHYIVHVKI